MMLMLSAISAIGITGKGAQQIMSDINKVYGRAVPYELTIIMEEEGVKAKPGDTINIRSNARNFYMTNGLTEEVMTRGIYLTVNHDQKSMSIEKMDSGAREWKTTYIDDFIAQLKEIKLDTCLLYNPKPDSMILVMSYMATNLYLSYSDSSKRIHGYEIESFNINNMKERSLSRVIYEKQVFSKPYTEKDFPLDDFITIGRDSIKINQKYKGYFFN